MAHHKLRYPEKDQLLYSINMYMTGFANQEAVRAKALVRQRQEPDEDGFITVTRGGRAKPARQEAAQEKAEKQKEKQSGLEDFYRFQTREKRKELAGELVRKFQEDRERVKKMREKRGKFRVSYRGPSYIFLTCTNFYSLSEVTLEYQVKPAVLRLCGSAGRD